MYDFTLQIVAVLSGAVIIYILSRGLKRVAENQSDLQVPFFVMVDGWFKKIPLRKFDEWILNFLEKFLRKIRVLNLKIENAINSGIGKLRYGDGEVKTKKDESEKDIFVK